METGIDWAVEAVTPRGTPPAVSDRTIGRPGTTATAQAAQAVVVHLSGRLGTVTAPDLVAGLAELLADRPAVVADVSGLVPEHTGVVHAFVEAMERAGGWPDAKLALAAPGATLASLLHSSRVARRIPVHPDVATALADVDRRPELVRAWWHFAVDVRAPGTARSYIRRVCEQWDVDAEVCEAAEIVVTELVTNAVEHACSPSTVEVERIDGSFRVSVRDFDAHPLPEVSPPAPTAPRGRGLAMVAAVARDWGVRVHADGKSVWADMAA